jgi:[ribosomal protein S5]-alanine N-acetyltransferase
MADASQVPPTIELNGIRLRPLQPADAKTLYDYLSEPGVTELTAYPEVTMSLVEGMIEKYRNRWAAGELSKWGIARSESDQVIGTCGFNDCLKMHRWAELAYDLSQDFWGHGLMKQAVTAVLRWTFAQNEINRVHAFVRIDNQRSQSFLERFGFVREGCLRSFRMRRGQPYDFYVYSLLRGEWSTLNG